MGKGLKSLHGGAGPDQEGTYPRTGPEGAPAPKPTPEEAPEEVVEEKQAVAPPSTQVQMEALVYAAVM